MADGGRRIVMPGDPGGTRMVNNPVPIELNIKRPSMVAVEGWKPRLPTVRDYLIGWKKGLPQRPTFPGGGSPMPDFSLPGEAYGMPANMARLLSFAPIAATDCVAVNFQEAAAEWNWYQKLPKVVREDAKELAKIQLLLNDQDRRHTVLPIHANTLHPENAGAQGEDTHQNKRGSPLTESLFQRVKPGLIYFWISGI